MENKIFSLILLLKWKKPILTLWLELHLSRGNPYISHTPTSCTFDAPKFKDATFGELLIEDVQFSLAMVIINNNLGMELSSSIPLGIGTCLPPIRSPALRET